MNPIKTIELTQAIVNTAVAIKKVKRMYITDWKNIYDRNFPTQRMSIRKAKKKARKEADVQKSMCAAVMTMTAMIGCAKIRIILMSPVPRFEERKDEN